MSAPGDDLDIEIRPATAQDARAIGEVFSAAVSAGWRFLGDVAAEPMFDTDHWDRLVADHAPANTLMVATDRYGGVVGYTAVHPADGGLFLLFVHPDHARRGVGRLLLDAAHEALRGEGCATAVLFTHEENERALSVYAGAGYRPDGSIRESDFRGVAIRELRLVKQL